MAQSVIDRAESFSGWVDEAYAGLFRLALHHTEGQHEPAADLLSGVLAYLWQLCEKGEVLTKASFLTLGRWLLQRRRHSAMEQISRDEKRLSLDEMAEEVGFEVPDHELDFDQVEAAVSGAVILDKLPPYDRFLLGLLTEGLDQKDVAAQLGVSPSTICVAVGKARVRLDALIAGQAVAATDVVAALLAESGWQTRHEITRQSGRSRDWVHLRLSAYANCCYRDVRNGRKELLYPRFVMNALVAESRLYREARDWLSVGELARLLGCTWEWTRNHLGMLNVRPETRLHRLTKRPYAHYPPSVIGALRRLLLESQPAGDWLTPSALSKLVGRHRWWVINQLRLANVTAEPRLNRSNRLTMHYPPSVVPLLQELNKELPLSGDWLTIPQIERAVGQKRDWVISHLRSVGAASEIRQVWTGRCYREFPHYPPSVVEALHELANSEQEPNDWLTTLKIAAVLDRAVATVQRWLEGYPYEMRLASNNRLERHYSPETVEQLRQRSEATPRQTRRRPKREDVT